MAKRQNSNTSTRAKAAGRNAGDNKAAIGATLLGGIAIAAALFAGWRRRTGDESPASSGQRTGDTPPSSPPSRGAEEDADKLHALGTPTTLPIDGGVRSYTGGRDPDMAVDYVPGEDVGSPDPAATRDR